MEIDWSPYYDYIFTVLFKTMKNDLPNKGFNQVDNILEYDPKLQQLFKNSHVRDFITPFLVSMMRSSKYSNYEMFWQHLERLINLSLTFIHPQNHGHWTVNLAQFYDRLSRDYIKRCFKEKNRRKAEERKAKKQRNLKDGIIELTSPLDSHNNQSNMAIEIEDSENNIDGDFEDSDCEEEDKIDSQDQNEIKDSEMDSMKNEDTKAYHYSEDSMIDEPSHQRFIEIMKNALNYLIYSSDELVNIPVAKICRVIINITFIIYFYHD